MDGWARLAELPGLKVAVVVHDVEHRPANGLDTGVSGAYGVDEVLHVPGSVERRQSMLGVGMQTEAVEAGDRKAFPGCAANVCQPCGPSDRGAQVQGEQRHGFLRVQQLDGFAGHVGFSLLVIDLCGFSRLCALDAQRPLLPLWLHLPTTWPG